MRLFLLILTFGAILPSIGCSSNLKCRREAALLRAEYLDLEDKYYALLANSGATSTPASASARVATTAGDLGTAAAPSAAPVIYGSGVQHVESVNTMPEIIYYDQGYPTQEYSGQSYPVDSYPVQSYPVEGETFFSDASLEPTPATMASPNSSAAGSGVRGSQSFDNAQDSYYPSPLEGTGAEVNSNESTEELPSPDSILDEDLDNEQSRFDFEVEEAQEIGHEIKIEMSSPITEVVINKSVSQGKNSDGRPGDDGIELLIQPKAADGSVVDEAGNLTITLIDPAADQGERQLGKWSFLKEEASLFFAEDEFDNRGILLDLKWEMIPINKRLTVYVRFETSDDRVMETTSDIFIDPPNELTMIQQQREDDFEFVQMERNEDQGWYKSQTIRRRNERENTNDYYNWGQSKNPTGKRSRDFQTTTPITQPQWRPSR